MRWLTGYPRWFFPVVLGVLIVLLVTGVVLIPPMLEMRMEWDVPVHVSGALRLPCAATHSTAAFIALTLVGALSVLHVPLGWQRARNLVSGTVLLALLALLLITGIGVYYLGEPDWSRYSSAAHTVAGLAAAAVFTWHLVRGRQLRRALECGTTAIRRPSEVGHHGSGRFQRAARGATGARRSPPTDREEMRAFRKAARRP